MSRENFGLAITFLKAITLIGLGIAVFWKLLAE